VGSTNYTLVLVLTYILRADAILVYGTLALRYDANKTKHKDEKYLVLPRFNYGLRHLLAVLMTFIASQNLLCSSMVDTIVRFTWETKEIPEENRTTQNLSQKGITRLN
jgi:hypothetical protein